MPDVVGSGRGLRSAKAADGGKTREEGRQAAIKIWRGNDFQTGEGENPYYRTCFGDREPLDEEFEETGETILKDIFQRREEITAS